jgi:hypothetical protein
MPRQLRDMLTDLRAEIGHSTNVAHGINDRDTLVYYLGRTQRRLLEDYDWPQLYTSRDLLLAPGQRHYAYSWDMRFEEINRVFLCAPDPMFELGYGIGPTQFAFYNSEQGATGWPPQRWQHASETDQYEVWPVPNATASSYAILQFWGHRAIEPMVADSDVATLPDNLIVLFCAAELLARDNAKDAQLKLQQANEAMRRYRVRQNKDRPFVVGGHGGDGSTYGGRLWTPTLGLDYIPPGYGSGP